MPRTQIQIFGNAASIIAALANTWTSLNTSSVASLLHLAATLSSRDQLLCPGMGIRLEVAPVQDTLFPWQV